MIYSVVSHVRVSHVTHRISPVSSNNSRKAVAAYSSPAPTNPAGASIHILWRKYVYTHIYIHTHIYICTYVCIHTYAHTFIYTIHTHIHKYTSCDVYMYIHTYIYIHAYIYIHTYIYLHTYIYIHTYIHMYTCIYIYIHMHTHKYIHIHTHIHKYISCDATHPHTRDVSVTWPSSAKEPLFIGFFCGKRPMKDKASYDSTPPCTTWRICDMTLFRKKSHYL